jgi:hypothetical protein
LITLCINENGMAKTQVLELGLGMGEVLLLFFLCSFYEFGKVGIVESQFRTQVPIGQIWANI